MNTNISNTGGYGDFNFGNSFDTVFGQPTINSPQKPQPPVSPVYQ